MVKIFYLFKNVLLSFHLLASSIRITLLLSHNYLFTYFICSFYFFCVMFLICSSVLLITFHSCKILLFHCLFTFFIPPFILCRFLIIELFLSPILLLRFCIFSFVTFFNPLYDCVLYCWCSFGFVDSFYSIFWISRRFSIYS